MIKIEIPLKLPSLNDYVNACRTRAVIGANMKKRVEEDIAWFLKPLPKFKTPVILHFIWIEGNKRRDLDNVAFAKKFIIDTLVKTGKLQDDSTKHVKGFTDNFKYEKEHKVILKIEMVKNNE